MDKVCNSISDARKKVTALVIMARWIWIVNLLVAVAGIAYHRYDIATLAGFTWALSIVASAFGRRAAEYLVAMESTIPSEPALSLQFERDQ